MKRYVVFVFFNRRYRGGWGDVLRDESKKACSFNTTEEAESYLSSKLSSLGVRVSMTYQIVDTQTGEIAKAVL